MARAKSESSNSEEHASSDSEEYSSTNEQESTNEESLKRKHEEEDKPEKKVKVERIEKKQYGSEGNTVFVGQLSFTATVDDIRQHFSQCGKVLDVRLRMHPDGQKSRGFGHVDFETAEGKKAALELDGSEFMNRTIRVDNAQAAKGRAVDNHFGPKTSKVFVANLSYDTNEESLQQAFGVYGNIVGEIGLPIMQSTGRIRGIAYIQFETEDEAEAAVKGMNGAYVDGRPIRTDFSGDNDKDRLSERPGHQKFSDKFAGRGKKNFRGGRGGQRGGRGYQRGGGNSYRERY